MFSCATSPPALCHPRTQVDISEILELVMKVMTVLRVKRAILISLITGRVTDNMSVYIILTVSIKLLTSFYLCLKPYI